MKTVLSILICILSISCMTDRSIVKNKSRILDVLNIHQGIEYRDTTIIKDRIIEVKLPADTVKIDRILTYDTISKEIVPLPAISVKNGLAGATAWIDSKGLHVRAFLTAEIVPVTVHDTIKLEGAVKTITREVPFDVPLNWYQKLAVWVFSIELILCLAFIALKVLPKFFPQLKIFSLINTLFK
jgi:hypothetical protein